MIKEIFYYILAISIFLGGISLFSFVSNIYKIDIYVLIFIYIIFSVVILFLESKFLKNGKLFTILFIIQFLVLILAVKFQFKYLKNNIQNNTNTTIQQKQVFQTEEQKQKFTYGTIEEKIHILKDMNLSKEQIYKKLENNTEFRELIKNSDEKFESIYNK